MGDNKTKKVTNWRDQLRAAIDASDGPMARALMVECWAVDSGPMTASVINQAFDHLGGDCGLPNPVDVQITILRTYSVEPLLPLIKAGARLKGINLNINLGDFGTVVQDILTPSSVAYAANTKAVIIARQTRDVAPELWSGASINYDREVDRVVNEFKTLIEQFRQKSDAYLIIHSLEVPIFSNDGIAEIFLGGDHHQAVLAINKSLTDMAQVYKGVFILDYDGLVARHGRMNWGDEVRWQTMRLPIAMENLTHLSAEWLRYLVPISGCICKVLVVDLDNTLWGGVIGEDGIDGLRLEDDYPGAVYQDIQRTLKKMSGRGIALAICSKNNFDDAMNIINNHPGMILNADDFSAHRINWQDKAQNIKDIAAELNISTDAVSFLDDNPAERMQVRQALPDVNVIEINDDAYTYSKVIMSDPAFERLALTDDDRVRTQYFKQNAKRVDLKKSATTIEDFYRSLEMTLHIERGADGLVPRISQMTQKTNQFNLTSKRYSEQQIQQLIGDNQFHIYVARSTDRFGENGVIGLMIVRICQQVAEIDTLLMSCRVIGRTLETAFLSTVMENLMAEGLKKIDGQYCPTPKNALARDYYKNNGFQIAHETKGSTYWTCDLTGGFVGCPEWVDVTIKQKDKTL